jgi:hypothetical protein
MGEVVPLHPARRALFADARGAGLRVTWHDDADVVVLSLWRDDRCTGTIRLPPAEAARLAGFIVEHLGQRSR